MTNDDPSNTPATKADLGALKADLGALDTKLTGEMRALETRMTGEMHAMRDALSDDIRSLGVSVEKTNTNVLLLAEAITGVRAELKEDIAGLEKRLSARIDRLEEAVRVHSKEIKSLSQESEQTRREVASLRHDFERRDAERLTAIEARVTVLEKKTGIA